MASGLQLTWCYNDTIRTNTDLKLAEAIWQVTGLHNWLKQETVCAVSACELKRIAVYVGGLFPSVATTLSIIMQQMSLLSLLWPLDGPAAAAEHAAHKYKHSVGNEHRTHTQPLRRSSTAIHAHPNSTSSSN